VKKDIEIPKVEGIYMAVCHQYNATFKSDDWYAYLINDKSVPLEQVIVVSKGENKKNKTAVLRHKLAVLPAKSGAKIELMQQEVLALDNIFHVSFFIANKMFDKTFVFPKNSISKSKLKSIPLLGKEGVLQL